MQVPIIQIHDRSSYVTQCALGQENIFTQDDTRMDNIFNASFANSVFIVKQGLFSLMQIQETREGQEIEK